jgi:hypothetical protein
MRSYYMPARMTKIQNADNTKYCRVCRTVGTTCGGSLVWLLRKTVGQLPIKLNILLLHGSTTALGTYSNDLNAYVPQKPVYRGLLHHYLQLPDLVSNQNAFGK